jgi:hypothetical protein
MKTANLQGAALGWAVAKSEGEEVIIRQEDLYIEAGFLDDHDTWYAPHSVWAQAGPIIEREGIDLRQIKRRPFSTIELRHFDAEEGDVIFRPDGWNRDMVKRQRKPSIYQGMWLAKIADSSDTTVGWSTERDFLSPTPLIAAMRCYVASKLGPEIEVPLELVTAPASVMRKRVTPLAQNLIDRDLLLFQCCELSNKSGTRSS